MEEVFVGGEEVACGAHGDTALDDDAGARLGVLQHRLDGEADEVKVDAAVFFEIGRHGDEVVGCTSEGGGFRC